MLQTLISATFGRTALVVASVLTDHFLYRHSLSFTSLLLTSPCPRYLQHTSSRPVLSDPRQGLRSCYTSLEYMIVIHLHHDVDCFPIFLCELYMGNCTVSMSGVIDLLLIASAPCTLSYA